ncbi:bacteriophage T4 gp5 trimerization domain-containing protein, partial [Campylobacter jejuni]
GANQNTIIHKDEIRNVKGNKKEVVEGHYGINIKETLKIQTEKETFIRSKNNLLITTNASMGFEIDKNNTFVSDNSLSQTKTDYEVKAGNQILHQVGDTQIVTKGDCVIIKAGGVEVVIDSNGLVVRGGEIKAE